jgi:death-on-curing protein
VPPRSYPTVAEAIEIHRILIDEFGGLHGRGDQALLEATVFRPQNGYLAGVIEEAATLMESLAKHHAFIDENKRISFVLPISCLSPMDTR